jgi:hypothetical protein
METREPVDIATGIEGILARDGLGDVSHRGRSLIEEEYSLEAAVGRYRAIFLESTGQHPE